MAIVKQRIYQKWGEGPKDYKIIHVETSSDVVMRPSGDGSVSIEDAMQLVEALLKVINDRFDDDGVLKKENGGTGDPNGIADQAKKLVTERTFVTDLASTTPGKFDGTKNVSLGVTGSLPATKISGILAVEKGGTGVSSLNDALYKFITSSISISSSGLATDDQIGISDTSANTGKRVTIQDLATFIATLITTKPYVRSSSAPSNKDILWIDSGNSDIVKFYNGSSWVATKTAWA